MKPIHLGAGVMAKHNGKEAVITCYGGLDHIMTLYVTPDQFDALRATRGIRELQRIASLGLAERVCEGAEAVGYALAWRHAMDICPIEPVIPSESPMKISVRIGEHTHVGVPEGKNLLVQGARCPKCSQLYAICDGRGVIVALAPPGKITLAKKNAEADGRPGPFTVDDPNIDPAFRVRMPKPEHGDHGSSGEAECSRCRQIVGHVTVTYDTLFGVEEDGRVLNGRCRVY